MKIEISKKKNLLFYRIIFIVFIFMLCFSMAETIDIARKFNPQAQKTD
jgi:hypothetical protein